MDSKSCACGRGGCPFTAAPDDPDGLCHLCREHHQPVPEGKRQAVITYDPDLIAVGRIAALRIIARRPGRAGDMEVLADAFEELTRDLPRED